VFEVPSAGNILKTIRLSQKRRKTMSIKKLSFMLLSTISLAALLNGCGSSNKEGSPGGVARVADEGVCIHCHSTTVDHVSGTNIVADYFTASHNPANSQHATGCEGCHGGGAQHNGVGPFPYPNPFTADRCIQCHIPAYADGKDLTPLFALAKANNGAGWTANKCAHCHTVNGAGGVHAAQVPATDDCIKCHDVAAPQHGTGGVGSVSDNNNGVRAITSEFAKWSHHVTGVTLNAAHCAACHLEGKVDGGKVVIDQTKHMADATIHLRNADDDSDFAWNPATPAQADFTGMDNFCMSCHDADGATSTMSRNIQQFINTNGLAAAGKVASPSNPFGDTISNRYDKMQRPAVVNAKDQFDTGNNSHHAVRGKRYTGRTRVAGDARTITSAATFAANSSALLKGARSTIYDAGNFNALYSPLGTDGTAATGLGDDSTLHCGDCHTVGQWKVGSSDTANGSPTPAAIGAHGSNNEYLLRNTLGTDERHTQNAFVLSATNVVTYTNPNGAFLVCYNCHSYTKYGSIYVGTGLNTPGTGVNVQPHAGEYDQQGRCNGIGNTIPFNGYTTGAATDGTQFESRFMGSVPAGYVYPKTSAGAGTPLQFTYPAPYAGEQQADFGNIFGIQCANCHNSGMGNAYGGIHGSKNNQNTVTQNVNVAVTGGAYIDGMGNTTKIERFLPGLGNAMHVPGTLGGFTGGTTVPVNTATGPAYTYTTGGISNDTNWEQKFWQQTATTNFDLSGKISPAGASAGAGCYTLGAATAATSALRGPSVTGAGGPATELLDTWGGCEDHGAAQGKGDHGFVKRIVRPVTY
jgi:hypothetical protein